MSYDIYLRSAPCPTCSRFDSATVRYDSPTYNLTPIFDKALTDEPLPNPEINEGHVVIFGKETDRPRGLRVLSGKKASDTIEAIRTACERLEDPARANEFRALEPENKWGTLETARECMRALLKDAEDNPDFIWDIR